MAYHHHLGSEHLAQPRPPLYQAAAGSRDSASASPIARSWRESSPPHAIASSVLALRAAR
jgi:hypothetical protein